MKLKTLIACALSLLFFNVLAHAEFITADMLKPIILHTTITNNTNTECQLTQQDILRGNVKSTLPLSLPAHTTQELKMYREAEVQLNYRCGTDEVAFILFQPSDVKYYDQAPSLKMTKISASLIVNSRNYNPDFHISTLEVTIVPIAVMPMW